MTDTDITAKKKDPVVYSLVRASRCHHCDRKLEPASIVRLVKQEDDREVLCDRCSEFSGLEFLPSGNSKITQIARKKSSQYFVVLRWSELWKTYERQGLLVESTAIDEAESTVGTKAKGRKKVASD